MGAAVPRAAADRRGAATAPASWATQHPELREITEKLAEGHAVEGMESLAPVLVDEHGAARRPAARETPTSSCSTPSGCAARAHDLVATSEEFLQASWAAAAAGGAGADRPRRGVVPLARRRPRPRRWRRARRGGAQPLRPGRRRADAAVARSACGTTPARSSTPTSTSSRRCREPRRSRSGRRRPTAATSSGRSPTSGPGWPPAAGVVAGLRGARPGGADGRGAARARRRRRASSRSPGTGRRRPGRRRGRGHLRHPRPRARRRGAAARRPHRRRPRRPAVVDQGHAPDAGPAQEADRPARAQARRLRRARAARRRPLRRDEAARRAGRHPRVPRPRVRRLQARRPAGQALRARPTSSTRSPATSAATCPASTGSAAPTGPSARAAPGRRSGRSPPS